MKSEESMSRIVVGILIVVALIILAISLTTVGATETCPQDNGWTKIDSDDLSSYPVEGATQYCFKYGSPKSQGCEGGISDVWPPETEEKYCGLSHWSYFIGEEPTPTPQDRVTPTPTASPSATPTPTEKPVLSPTPTPTLTPAPTNTPTPGPTATPTVAPMSDEAEEEYRELLEEKPYLKDLGIK